MQRYPRKRSPLWNMAFSFSELYHYFPPPVISISFTSQALPFLTSSALILPFPPKQTSFKNCKCSVFSVYCWYIQSGHTPLKQSKNKKHFTLFPQHLLLTQTFFSLKQSQLDCCNSLHFILLHPQSYVQLLKQLTTEKIQTYLKTTPTSAPYENTAFPNTPWGTCYIPSKSTASISSPMRHT